MPDLSNLLPAITAACNLPEVRARLGRGEPPLVGVIDAAKAAAIAALTQEIDRPAIVITAKPAQAASFVEELSTWLGGSRPVLSFPERDALPYERLLPEPEAIHDRLAAVQALRAGRSCLVVASAIALAQRTAAGAGFEGLPIELRAGAKVSPEAVLASLLRAGYRAAPLVEAPGELARRGGIIDVFPAAAVAPVRIELLGNEVESLRRFDPETQRSQARVESITLGAAREVVDLPAAIGSLADGLDLSACTEDVRERLEEELARLQAGDSLPEEQYYVPFLAAGLLLDHLPGDGLLIIDEPAEVTRALEEHDEQAEQARRDLESRGELPAGLPAPHASCADVGAAFERHGSRVHLSRWAMEDGAASENAPAGISGRASVRLPFATTDAYGGRLRALASEAAESARRGRALVIVSQQALRIAEVLGEEGTAATPTERPPGLDAGSVVLTSGSLPHGWRLAASTPALTLLTDAEVFGFVKQRRRLPRRGAGGREAFLAELSPGDYVAHIEHGLARFAGMVHRTMDGVEREYLELRYDQGDRLLVPADQVDRVSRYVGPSDQPPRLTRLGSQEWTRAKERVRRAVADLARELLDLYATRQFAEGRAFSPDLPWLRELEASFPYVETPDQLAAVREVKLDMEQVRPMDRLVCGDVGYGKTEVAVRAAFKAVLDGTQVAVLVPTTVLAQQHDHTFHERLSGFPVRIEMLSRFRSHKEQQEVVAALAEGTVDVVIGTHRLLQKDVAFKNLGLVIIDEEQRFGVAHKERLKQMRREVDVLTLSATPIPRTLHMSLSGIRDMSAMETPPEQRLPIKTYVAEYDDQLVREAILRELERGGQVYFVHNRVHDIELVAKRLRDLVPEAEIGIGHGQQPEEALEQVMIDFVEGRLDVLVCTTIIESGLDIPNVNTIVIDKADKLGLAQLYQLRGRVGRGASRAYAYLLFDRYRALSETGQKRLQAIFEATELGAGFQIALRDLEIRGAGNLLGAEQSGHIGAVGFELYVRLLGDAVERLKAMREGRVPPPPRDVLAPVTIDLPLTAHIPATYVADLNVRLALYQRLAAVDTVEQVEEIDSELRDRFGPLPPALDNLLFAVRIRALARRAGVTAVQTEDGDLVVRASDGSSPRDRLRDLRIDTLRAGPTQARLRMNHLGERWPEALLQVMQAMAAGAAGVPAPAG